jgi:hypothetical protein
MDKRLCIGFVFPSQTASVFQDPGRITSFFGEYLMAGIGRLSQPPGQVNLKIRIPELQKILTQRREGVDQTGGWRQQLNPVGPESNFTPPQHVVIKSSAIKFS